MKKIFVLLVVIGILGGVPAYAATKPKVCRDAKCFLEAAKNCRSAKITESDKSSRSGVTVVQTLTDEIIGTSKKCSLKIKYDKYSIKFNDAELLKNVPIVSSTIKIDTKAFLRAVKADLNEKTNFQGKEAVCKLDTGMISEDLFDPHKSFFLMATALDPLSCKGTLIDFYKKIADAHYLETKDNNRLNDLKTLQTALAEYHEKFNTYPVQNITLVSNTPYCLDEGGFSENNCVGPDSFLNSVFFDTIVYAGNSNTYSATVKLSGKVAGIRSFVSGTGELRGTVRLTPTGISRVK